MLAECPVCWASDSIEFVGISTWDKGTYHLCKCGAAFLYPRMGDNELLEWYTSGAYREKTSKDGSDNENAIQQHKDRAGYITQLLGKLVVTSHLDVGCSSGELLRAVRSKYPGIFQMGVDPDTVLSTDEFVIVSDINDTEHEFDLITIIQTLEHLNNPNRMLRAIYERLAVGGLLMLEVPNRRADMVAYIPPQHVIAYDEVSLKSMLSEFKIIKTVLHGKPYNSPLDLSILILATK
jgi:SAM-dependent methyltransferase